MKKLFKAYVFSMVFALLVVLVVAIFGNLAFPIAIAIYTKNAMWLLLYLAEPLLVFLSIYTNALAEIVYDWI